jgi:hypothetical protein
MSSIFSLKTDARQLLLGNQGLSNMKYDQIAPTRDATTTNFPNGEINFKFDVGGGKWFVPQRSYLRIRCQISRGDNASLLESDNVAPAMNMMSNLFQSAEFKINGKTISRVSDFMGQVSSLKYRLDKSASWLDSVGNSTNFWDNHNSRKADVCADGLYHDAVFETSWGNLGFVVATDRIVYTHATTQLAFDDGAGGAVGVDVRTKFPIGSRIRVLGAFGTLGANAEMLVMAHIDATTLEVQSALTLNVAAANIQLERLTDGASSALRVNARRVSNVEIIWTPPLSIFDIEGGIPGSASCELTLTPQSSNTYQLLAIESTGATKTTGALATNVKFSVQNLYFYTNIISGPRIENSTYLLDLEQIACQASVVNNTDFAQHSFHVSPSTYALSVAIQDGRVGSDTRASASRFKSYNVAMDETEELKLNRLYVSYGGSNYPSPDAEPSYIEGVGGALSTDYSVNRYIDSNIYSGAFFGVGGCESIEQYHDRGAYHYFACPKDNDDASTRVVVNAGFQGTTNVANMRILLFAHSRQVARIEMIDGKVQSVMLEDS